MLPAAHWATMIGYEYMGRSKVNQYYLSTHQDQVVRVQAMLGVLELDTMSSSLEKIADGMRGKDGSHLDFLECLLEKEFVDREQARVERWVKNAKFPAQKSIEEFDFSKQPDLDRQYIKEIATCRFIKKGQNIVFFGPPGVGKTHLSIAIGREAILRGVEVKFITIDSLIEQIGRQDADGLSRLMRNLTNPPLLIIDDIDYEEPSKNVSTFLFKVIFRRDERKVSTIYTSNKSFREWEQLFSGDRVKASAAIDRIHNNDSHIINIAGDSYRLTANRIKSSGV